MYHWQIIYQPVLNREDRGFESRSGQVAGYRPPFKT